MFILDGGGFHLKKYNKLKKNISCLSIHPTEMEAKRLSLDIITTLPQTIIETILCLLEIEEAARTSILSREWRYKWTKIPKLELIETLVLPMPTKKTKLPDYEYTDKIATARKYMYWRCKFFYIIHQILLLRQGPIHEFTLVLNAGDACLEIDQIILHLSRNHTVKIMELNFMNESCSYGIPFSIFSFHHLTDLQLDYCDFNHKPIFNGFGSLTRLSLKYVTISRESLLHLLSNCPSLKTLYLRQLDEHYHGHEHPNIMELFKCLPGIEHLTTYGSIVPFFVQASVLDELTAASLFHLKDFCMELMNFDDVYGLTFLAVLMKCSPNLEKIRLKINTNDDYDVEAVKLEEFSGILEVYSDVWLEHLNEFGIKQFRNLKPEMELVKFILARSPNLKKVNLVTCMLLDKNEELEMTKVLLRAPRVSPVEILVENGVKDYDDEYDL
ncbi:hypothetical protein SSX86_028736 [Deinandra increscens subsp. villosa]|uniref:FBD domain-containing protein n=1 Tax=Deinandra increscens subsp. villosa TaxID=3103831 RepID=A0AAP0GJK2_9ASTR